MDRKTRSAQVALLGSAAVVIALSASPGAKFTLYPVTAEFRCNSKSSCGSQITDASGNSVFVLDRLQGDGLPYVGSTGGAYLDASYDFYFLVPSTSGRRVYLDFSARVGSPTCGSSCTMNFTEVWAGPSSAAMSPASMANPVDANGTALPNGFYGIPQGSAANAEFKFNFLDSTGKIRYTVRMNPSLYPGTSYVTVTRTDANAWTIEAGPDAVAALESQSTKTGQAPKILEGYFSMPFKITVTRQ